MQVTVVDTLKDYLDNEILSDGKPLTYRSVIVAALNTPLEADKDLSAEDKINMYKLSLGVVGQDTLDISIENCVLIKSRVHAIYNALVYGRVSDKLDPPSGTIEQTKEPQNGKD